MSQNWLILIILTYSNQIVSTFSVHNRLFLKTLQLCKLTKKKNKVNKKNWLQCVVGNHVKADIPALRETLGQCAKKVIFTACHQLQCML